MALVQNQQLNRVVVLHSQHTIGRDKNNTSVFTQSDISRKHAIIFWENNHWQLTDLSSNGTKVNGKLLHRATYTLKMNDEIQFSSKSNDVWTVSNLDAPQCYFKELDGSSTLWIHPDGELLELGAQTYAVFKNLEQLWVLDNGSEEVVLEEGIAYPLNGKKFTFTINEAMENTLLTADITKNACFKLFLSFDEEQIISKIAINDLELDLGNRVFNHLLLYLIREKQKDLSFGVTDTSCGWVYMDDLNKAMSKELLKEVDAYYINTLIHRLRKFLMKLKPYGFLFANIIERKKGQLRFGLSKFEINKERALA